MRRKDAGINSEANDFFALDPANRWRLIFRHEGLRVEVDDTPDEETWILKLTGPESDLQRAHRMISREALHGFLVDAKTAVAQFRRSRFAC